MPTDKAKFDRKTISKDQLPAFPNNSPAGRHGAGKTTKGLSPVLVENVFEVIMDGDLMERALTLKG